MLVEHLPDTSALAAQQRGGHEHRAWDFSAQLLATIANLLYAANRQRGGKKTQKPLVEPPKKRQAARVVTVAELLKQSSGATA